MKKLSKKQRAAVVELLRCAADVCWTDDPQTSAPVNTAEHGHELAVRVAAWKARAAVLVPASKGTLIVGNRRYPFVLLEAAARVEEGSYP